MIYTMLGIGLAGFSTDLWYYIITTRLYKWVKNGLLKLINKIKIKIKDRKRKEETQVEVDSSENLNIK